MARRRGLDLLRREHRRRDKLALVTWPARPEPDDRLRLIFTCCHPALSRSAQVALTLRVVCGLTTGLVEGVLAASGSGLRVGEHDAHPEDRRCTLHLTQVG